MRVEVYIKPQEDPIMCPYENNIRLNYNNTWIDFTNGELRLTRDDAEEFALVDLVKMTTSIRRQKYMVVQLQWQYPDGTYELKSQKRLDIYDPSQISAFFDETRKAHKDIPEHTTWALVYEDSPLFKYMEEPKAIMAPDND